SAGLVLTCILLHNLGIFHLSFVVCHFSFTENEKWKMTNRKWKLSHMDILERIRQRAGSKPQHIVLPEGNDPRTVVAAAQCTRERIARITLLGDENTIRNAAHDNGVDLGGVEIIDH